ncbi:MAG TPA: triose-phosphate isomerase [Pseudolabrys sp.]|jgi:triosephosphate isomerase|nr:triose-phosphate isomerase [Pseudolabrys sp.]
MSDVRPLVAGNWKMNGLKASAAELGRIMQGGAELWRKVDLMICPPATLLVTHAVVALGSKLQIGAQDCHAQPSGAFTGDISAEMIADAGPTAVIVGHSERRTLHHETDAQVRAKALAAWRAGLTAIVCIGETKTEREAGKTLDVLAMQLDGSLPENGATGENLVVAYEPVWAIGTGLTPTANDVAEAHRFIRERLNKRYGAVGSHVRILYGGSVKPSNAKELLTLPNVNGALVGGASLKAEDFLGIAGVYR